MLKGPPVARGGYFTNQLEGEGGSLFQINTSAALEVHRDKEAGVNTNLILREGHFNLE